MKVTLLEGSPKEIAVAGALGCRDKKSSADILTELQSLSEYEKSKKCEVILKNSFGRGHGAVGDQANFAFSLEGVTRLTTLFLCQSPFASFLQQSMRVVKVGSYKLPESLQSKNYAVDVVEKSFELYRRMVESGIPEEDARYILPLCAITNIQMNVNARGLCQLVVMAMSKNAPWEVKQILSRIDNEYFDSNDKELFADYGPNYEPLSFYPAPDLFGEDGPIKDNIVHVQNNNDFCGWRSIDTLMNGDSLKKAIIDRNSSYLSLLKHIHFTFTFGLSLAAFHQAVRQRTWDHTVETLNNAASQFNRMVIPPNIKKSDYYLDFVYLHDEMIENYRKLIANGISKSDAFNLIPHSLKIYDLVHINGWNAIHGLGKRRCGKAQWEIREIANKAGKIIKEQYPELVKYVNPQCIAYGYCPESKPCGKFKKEIDSEN